MGIILTNYQQIERIVTTHSSDNIAIENYQQQLLLKSDENNADAVEYRFGGSKYQGVPSPCYNCHGLTFASKRTGIYDDQEIWKILDCEYREIKLIREVLVGDIIVYFYGDGLKQIAHSGVVVVANHMISSDIKVYSKVLKGREIVHTPNECAYNFGNFRYFRINHASRIHQSV